MWQAATEPLQAGADDRIVLPAVGYYNITHTAHHEPSKHGGTAAPPVLDLTSPMCYEPRAPQAQRDFGWLPRRTI